MNSLEKVEHPGLMKKCMAVVSFRWTEKRILTFLEFTMNSLEKVGMSGLMNECMAVVSFRWTGKENFDDFFEFFVESLEKGEQAGLMRIAEAWFRFAVGACHFCMK